MRVQVPLGQHVKRSRAVVAYVRCSERCSIEASARLRAAGRSGGLGPVAKAGAKGKRVRVRLSLRGRAAKAVTRAARRRQLVEIRVTLRAWDSVGNPSKKKRVSARLRP